MEQNKFIQFQPTNYTLHIRLSRLLGLQLIILIGNCILKLISSILTQFLQQDTLFTPFIFIGGWCVIIFYFLPKFMKSSMIPGDLSLEFEEDKLKLLNKDKETLIPYEAITSIIVSVDAHGTYNSIKLQTAEQSFTLSLFAELETILQRLADRVSENCPILMKQNYTVNIYIGNLLLLVLNLNYIIFLLTTHAYLPRNFLFLIGVLIYLLSFLPRKCNRSIPISYRPLPATENFNATKDLKSLNKKMILLHKLFIYQAGFVLALFFTQILLLRLEVKDIYIIIIAFSVLTAILLVLASVTLYLYSKKYLISSNSLTVNEEGITFSRDSEVQTYKYKDFIKAKAYVLKTGTFQGILCRTTTETFFLSGFENLEAVFEHFKLHSPSDCTLSSQKFFLSSIPSFIRGNLLLLVYSISLLLAYIGGRLIPSLEPISAGIPLAMVVIFCLFAFVILKPRSTQAKTSSLVSGPKIWVILVTLLFIGVIISTLISTLIS